MVDSANLGRPALAGPRACLYLPADIKVAWYSMESSCLKKGGQGVPADSGSILERDSPL